MILMVGGGNKRGDRVGRDIYIIVSYHHGRRTDHHIFSTDLLLGFLDQFIVRPRKIIIYLTDLKKKILWKGDNSC